MTDSTVGMAMGIPPTMMTSMLVRVGHNSVDSEFIDIMLEIYLQKAKSGSCMSHYNSKAVEVELTLAELAAVVVVTELHCQLDDAPGEDGDEAYTSNTGHDLCQICHVVCALHAIASAASGQSPTTTVCKKLTLDCETRL